MARWDLRQRLVMLVMLFTFALGMLAMLHGAPVSGASAVYTADFTALLITIGLLIMIFMGAYLFPKWFGADPLLMTMMNFLCALGVLVQYSISRSGGLYHALWYAIGSILMVVASLAVRRVKTLRRWWPHLAVLAAVLLIAPLFNTVNGAHAHIPIQRVTDAVTGRSMITLSIQPSEGVKILLIVLLADMLSGHSWRPDSVWAMGVAAMCVGLLIAEDDLGTCVLYAMTALLMFFAATGSFTLLFTGVAGGAGSAWLVYQNTGKFRTRVEQWLNPFMRVMDDKGGVGLKGYQIAESLMALAAGGVHGLGYGIRDTFRWVPEYSNDFVFSVVCSQFGAVFALAVLAVYVVILFRGMRIAQRARRRFHALLAIGVTALIGFQTFVIVGGVVNMFPLTGVTMPFISQGGSSMLSCMALMGVLNGVYACADQDERDARAILGQYSAMRSTFIWTTREVGG
ncbi:MAG: FtsW/RodA/SpoVE family cell cycle protein [Oscillospiraceae bacterium]|jgi:cell division protein FtsW (lipid II flippase)|nr:FtsW/RodA/SpoVE family cell cycle protein [Oscillospiraceae bacterium]